MNWVKCENCKQKIKASRLSNAHILPKHEFPSVSTCVLNHMYLCFHCHSKFDSSWKAAQTMVVWNLASKRVQKFKHIVTENSPILELFKKE